MQDASRRNWAIGTAEAHIEVMRAAAPTGLSELARSYDWAAHAEPVLGWVMAQKCVDLGTAVTVFFHGEPERFNYLSKRSVPRCHAPDVRLLDNICLRINSGFYLPVPEGMPEDAARLDNWLAAQRADRAEGARGRWVLDEQILARIVPDDTPPVLKAAPATHPATGEGWRDRLQRLLVSVQWPSARDI